jgi:hypothetical protein
MIGLLPKHNNIWSYPSRLLIRLGFIRLGGLRKHRGVATPSRPVALIGRRSHEQIDSI